MNTTHYLAGDISGGAARAVIGLHGSLNLVKGFVSKVRPQYGRNSIEGIYPIASNKITRFFTRQYLSGSFCEIENCEKNTNLFSHNSGLPHSLVLDKRDSVHHLHFLGMGYLNLKNVNLDKPTVWTLRDMWSFTGGCHYTGNCTQYLAKCTKCSSNIGYRIKATVAKGQDVKREFIVRNNIHIVAISDWLANQFKSSAVGRDIDVSVIDNNVDTSNFFCCSAEERTLLPKAIRDKGYLLAGAQNLGDHYKGFDDVAELSHRLAGKKTLAVFGSISDNFKCRFHKNTLFLGFINSVEELRRLYSFAECFIVPSKLEAFGKVVLEALLCECRVAVREGSAIEDVVSRVGGGVLLKREYSPEWGDSLDECLSMKFDFGKIRESIVENYSNSAVASRYLDLYKRIS